MVHLLMLATCWLDFRQRQRFFLFSIHLQTEGAFFANTVNCVFVQMYECGLIMNSRELNNEKLRTQFIYAINNVPFQMYMCCLVMLLRQLVCNFSTTELDLSKIFLQLFKCTSVVLKSDRPPQQNALTIDT